MTQEPDMDVNEFEQNINWMNVDEMAALSDAVTTEDNMVTNIPTLLTDKMSVGIENCLVGIEGLLSFGYDTAVDRDLKIAVKDLESRLPLKNYADALKLTVPKPVGMTTTYNEHISKLVSTGPAIARAKASILELDATLAKAISEKDYRTAMVRLDGDAKTRLKEVTELTKELLIDMKGDEAVDEVVHVFKDINGIPELATKFADYNYDVNVEDLSDIAEVLTDRANKFKDMIDYHEVSKDMLNSVNTIIVSTANTISMVAAVLANVRNTKKALTKAIELIR